MQVMDQAKQQLIPTCDKCIYFSLSNNNNNNNNNQNKQCRLFSLKILIFQHWEYSPILADFLKE